jgi:hypothetical protein
LRHFSDPINFIKIVELFDIGRKTSMNTEYLIINNSSDSEVVKDLSEGPPYVERPILLDALIIETINLSN